MDNIGKWAEQNVINQQMVKKWMAYEESRPQLHPNWDRGAKRPPPVPKQKEMKPKAKPSIKHTKREVNTKKVSSSPFEEVVFKTPPLTPPPPKPDLVKKPSYTRDDAFWEFYDQDVPN